MVEEHVMAVRTGELFRAGSFQGLRLGGEPWLRFIFEPKNCHFLPRAAAENDPAWKQVIPYILLVSGNEVFGYRRGQRSTESRLRALYSIGLGGHIRAQDESLFAEPGWDAYRAGLERELREEVDAASEVTGERLVGLINDDAVAVGRVHIGLVHLRVLARPVVTPRESKIAAPRFATPAQWLQDAQAEMETWSRFCLEQWDQLVSQPGWTPQEPRA